MQRTLLLAAALALGCAPAVASSVRVNVHVQPWPYVRSLCGPDQPWGCITWSIAVDNPNDRRCVVHIPNDQPEWDWPVTEDRLRRQCERPE